MRKERGLLWFFDLSLVLKAINGALEVVGGLLVLAVPPTFIIKVVEFVTAGELDNDPDDVIANSLRDAAHSFAVHAHYLIAIYLILHGTVKALLVLGIFAGKKIAYPLLVLALALFGAYEAYLGLVRHETLLGVLAVFDCMLIVLTLYEYHRRYAT